ncbi:hypothetical protein D3C71_1914410 [compost metagenome]
MVVTCGAAVGTGVAVAVAVGDGVATGPPPFEGLPGVVVGVGVGVAPFKSLMRPSVALFTVPTCAR